LVTSKIVYDGDADVATRLGSECPYLRAHGDAFRGVAGRDGCTCGLRVKFFATGSLQRREQLPVPDSYSNACGMLDTGVRDALIKRMGSRTTCSKLFVQCLPSKATNISRDQAQLLYATIQVATHHHKADVTVAGTAVARAIKRVTLAKERGTWKLTSYGDALRRCPHKAHRLRAGRGSPRPTVG
jgi:hypothetical protein